MAQTFEDFLVDKFGKKYNGTEDNWEYAQDVWFSQLDVQELIDYAQEWGDERMSKHIGI